MSRQTADLNELSLLQVLEQASNPQHAGSQVQRLAEQQLKTWETQSGYHYLLQSIYLDLSCSLQIRWLAIIQFKNGIERYWRSTRVNAISKDEKASIRSRLFDMIDEQNNQLCIQNAQASSRIARLDFPNEWPNLFEFLEQMLNNDNIWQDNIKVYNLLVHLNQIIKVLATARIGRCRPAMQSKVPLVFPLIVRIYLKTFNAWTTSNGIDEDDLTNLQVSYLSLKVLRRITTEGYESPHRNQPVTDFMSITVGHFEMLISHYDSFKRFDIFEKFIKCYGKLYYNMISNSPSNFILLPCSLKILMNFTRLLVERASDVYQENAEVTGDFWEQVSIRGLLILKKIINFIHKKGAVTIKAKNDKAEVDAAVSKISNEFLNAQLVTKLVDLLMEWYLKLRPTELENWSMDPEEWINEQMATSFEYQIRPCAENFFQDLINCFQQVLVPYLLNKIENEASQLSDSLNDFLKKDAIFASFQLSASSISDVVDFDRLLMEVFLPEANNPNHSTDQLKIIRRRVSLIINEWCTIKCSDESRQNCYKFFLQVLTTDTDKVVQLTAIQTLRTMVDEWDFNKYTFQPYLNDFVTLFLRKMLPAVSLTETRLYVLNTLSDVIYQTTPLVSKELLIEILQIVPELWELANNDTSESILANALLRLLRYLVISLGKYSHATWEISLPIVQIACDPSSPHYSLLYEDGFELWQSLLQNFSSEEQKLDDKLVQIIRFLEYAVQHQTEILPTLLEIMKSYTLILSREGFFACEEFSRISVHLSKFLLKLRDDSFDIVLSIWQILTLMNEGDSEALLLNNFFQNGVLSSMFDAVFLEESISLHQCGNILLIIARIAFANPQSIIEFLSSYQQTLPTSEENNRLPQNEKKLVTKEMPFDNVVNKFVSIWIVCFKEIYDPKLKKAHILGLSSMLKTGLLPILSEFKSIAFLWIDMMEEINETTNGDCEKYHLSDNIEEESRGEHAITCEQIRYYQLQKNNDPVHNISLKQFISDTMQFLEKELGGQYQDFLNSVDKNILDNLQLFLSITPQRG